METRRIAEGVMIGADRQRRRTTRIIQPCDDLVKCSGRCGVVDVDTGNTTQSVQRCNEWRQPHQSPRVRVHGRRRRRSLLLVRLCAAWTLSNAFVFKYSDRRRELRFCGGWQYGVDNRRLTCSLVGGPKLTIHLSRTAAAAAASATTGGSNEKDQEVEVVSPSGGRGNQNVRRIMSALTSRYSTGNNNNDMLDVQGHRSWSRTRNYVYRASPAGLTLDQVEEVLSFLDEVFPNDPDIKRLILQSSPRILRKSVETHLAPTVEFLLGLYGPVVFYQAISRNPDLLIVSGVGYDSNKNQDDTKSYLRTKLNFNDASIRKLQRMAPWVFQLSVTDKLEPVVTFLLSTLERGGYGPSGEGGVGGGGGRFGDANKVIKKVIMNHPNILNLSVSANLQPHIDFLVESCYLTARDVSNVIKSSPGILGLSVEDNLKPTIEFLSNILAGHSNSSSCSCNGKDEKDVVPERSFNGSQDRKELLRKCISGHPQLLALSLENLQMKVAYFDAIDKLSSHQDDENAPKNTFRSADSLAARIAVAAPASYSLSLKSNLIPTVEFLGKVWDVTVPVVQLLNDGSIQFLGSEHVGNSEMVGSSESGCTDSLAHWLREYPRILTLSLEGNIQPTINFYNRTGYIDLDEIGNVRRRRGNLLGRGKTTIRGRYIATSLFNRLLPRWHFLMEKKRFLREEDRTDDDDENAKQLLTRDVVTNLPPLHLIAGATDSEFCKQMRINLSEYVEYKEMSVPGLKFRSQFDTWLKTGRPIDDV